MKDEKFQIPEPSFASIILVFSSAALQHLGIIPNPMTKKEEINIPMAKHTIDTLAILKEKTRGNLTSEESRVLDEILHDMRIRYVAQIEKEQKKEEEKEKEKKGKEEKGKKEKEKAKPKKKKQKKSKTS